MDGGLDQYIMGGKGGFDKFLEKPLAFIEKHSTKIVLALVIAVVIYFIWLIVTTAIAADGFEGAIASGGPMMLGQDNLGGSTLVDTSLYGGGMVPPAEFVNNYCSPYTSGGVNTAYSQSLQGGNTDEYILKGLYANRSQNALGNSANMQKYANAVAKRNFEQGAINSAAAKSAMNRRNTAGGVEGALGGIRRAIDKMTTKPFRMDAFSPNGNVVVAGAFVKPAGLSLMNTAMGQ